MPFQAHPADHRFYGTMSVVAAAVLIAGFASVYAPKVMTGTPPVLPIVHLHAALFLCWLALFVAQAALVSRGHVEIHMRVGQAAAVCAAPLSATGVWLSLAAWLVR